MNQPPLTPGHLIEYLFCPRFTYFEYVLRLPQYEDKHYKVLRGRRLHDERLERNKAYLRKRIGAADKQLDVYLGNALLRGRVDEVLTLQDGSMAPLDYKFAEWNERTFRTYRIQLACYAWLIQDTWGVPVRKGFLVYTRSRNHLEEVPIGEQELAEVRQAAAEVLEIIEKNRFPKGVREAKKCVHCTYGNVCIK